MPEPATVRATPPDTRDAGPSLRVVHAPDPATPVPARALDPDFDAFTTDAPPRRATPVAGLGDLLLSRDANQRTFILRSLLGSLNAMAGLLALHVGRVRGLVDPAATWWLTGVSLVAVVLFYGLLRSGLNRRARDPSLTEFQLLPAITFMAVGYYLGAPARPVAIILSITMIMFGMFMITRKQVVRTSFFAWVALSAAMGAVALQSSDPDEVWIQLVYFVLISTILPSVSLLAGQLAALRHRLWRRQNELRHALGQIAELATRDELTGLLNRRAMNEFLENQIRLHSRSGTDFCLCMIDVDHFKSINDAHGHAVGDDVLQRFAQVLLEALRDSDIVARWGGEEFLVILAGRDQEAAFKGIERVRDLLVGPGPLTPRVPDLRVTFSAGLTAFQQGDTMVSVLARADRLLYEAKSFSRNCTVMG